MSCLRYHFLTHVGRYYTHTMLFIVLHDTYIATYMTAQYLYLEESLVGFVLVTFTTTHILLFYLLRPFTKVTDGQQGIIIISLNLVHVPFLCRSGYSEQI